MLPGVAAFRLSRSFKSLPVAEDVEQVGDGVTELRSSDNDGECSKVDVRLTSDASEVDNG